MTEQVGRDPQYDDFAGEFLDHARDGFYNAHYDRPACLGLLGDVAGRRVLDAACGPGLYARELLARGARVTGFDVSPRMVAIAREQAPGGEYRVHDLNEPLDWAPDGALVLSRLHPTGDWLRHGGNYHEARVITETWERGWTVRYWLVPLEQLCEEIAAAGFVIERLLEPRPAPGAAAVDPERFARMSAEPRGFLALRLRPRPAGW